MSNFQFDPFANNIQQYIDKAVKKAIKDMQTCIPAIVKKVVSREQVIVIPAVQQTNASWEAVPWASVLLPVNTPMGNNGGLSLPVAVGDVGWIVAGDLDSSLFLKDPSKPARQNTFERHSYQHGFFLPAKVKDWGVSEEDKDGIVLHKGNTKIVLKDDSVEIISNDSLKIKAKSVNIQSNGSNVVIDGLNFKNHKHLVPSGIQLQAGEYAGATTQSVDTGVAK